MRCEGVGANRSGTWLVACVSMALGCAVSVAAQHDEGPQGGHPLNREKRPTLEDLLNAPDWGAAPASARPKATTLPPPPEEPQEDPAVTRDEPRRDEATGVDERDQPARRDDEAGRNLTREAQHLVAERNRLIDHSDMFDTLPEIFRHEAECARRWAVLQQCLKRQRLAAGTVDQITAIGPKAAPGARERAVDDFRDAQRASQQAHGDWLQEVNALQPLYGRIQPALVDWLACYERMRSLLKSDRRDPNRRGVLDVFDGAVKQRDDFYEGRVLAALAEAYDGRSEAAANHLAKACAGFGKYRLFGTTFAHDCCHAYLLIGQPAMVERYVADLRKLDAARLTSVRCWLVGCYGMLTCRDGEADSYFQKALAKAKLFAAADPPAGVEPLIGDAALFCLTVNTEAKRNVEKARKILDKAPVPCDDWRVLRARAALAAADGKWDESLELLDECRTAAPPTLDGELEAQRKAYGSKEPWVRPRPPAKAAAREATPTPSRKG